MTCMMNSNNQISKRCGCSRNVPGIWWCWPGSYGVLSPLGSSMLPYDPVPSAAIRDRVLEDLALGAVLQYVLIRKTQFNRISFRKSTQRSQQATLDISQCWVVLGNLKKCRAGSFFRKTGELSRKEKPSLEVYFGNFGGHF